jgi:monofunctional biosynthetic peptidoglycan transglycosylase
MAPTVLPRAGVPRQRGGHDQRLTADVRPDRPRPDSVSFPQLRAAPEDGPRGAGPRGAGPRGAGPRGAGPERAGPERAGLAAADPRSSGTGPPGGIRPDAGAATAPPRRVAGPDRDRSRPGSSRPRVRRHPILRVLLRGVQAGVVLLVLIAVAVIGMGFWIRAHPPEYSAFMKADSASPVGLIYQPVDIDHVSRNMIAAVIGHEDQTFAARANGVNYGDYAQRAKDYFTNTDDDLGSTLPEQLAKNLWLSPARNPARMLAEVAITEGMMVAVPKQDQLEMYLNFAQFGPHLYGICAASWYYFNTPPSYMAPDDAMRLTGILPGPGHVVRGTSGGFVSDGTPVGDKIIREVGYAQQHAEQWIAAIGGYAAAQSVGVTGFAADHRSETGAGSCTHRPDSVTALLQRGGYEVPAEPVLPAGD